MKPSPLFNLIFLSLFLTGCADTLSRLEGIGKPPALAKIDDPTAHGDYKPLSWPLPETPIPTKTAANSLWQPGARTFFRDGRASRVGDLLRVKINITDQAEFDNNTTSTRTTAETANATGLFGLQNRLNGVGLSAPTLASGLNISGGNTHDGNVTAKRKETVQTEVAAMVTQVLPNGNFVISGKQEFLMNYDVRDISIKGVVRPQDIGSDNTVDSTQVAEARITYGGHGQNMDVQQARWGSQAVEVLSPF